MKTQWRDVLMVLLICAFAGGALHVIRLSGKIKDLEEQVKKMSERPAASVALPAPSGHSVGPMHAPESGPLDPRPPAPTSGPLTTIAFKKLSHDFGAVKQNTENVHWFEFTNSGREPLIISNAQASCGCTVPEYPKEPIPPGGKGKIKVVYSPGTQEGQQTKTVTVTANTQPPQTLLTITAKVVKE